VAIVCENKSAIPELENPFIDIDKDTKDRKRSISELRQTKKVSGVNVQMATLPI
jgi:hypothetical protein